VLSPDPAVSGKHVGRFVLGGGERSALGGERARDSRPLSPSHRPAPWPAVAPHPFPPSLHLLAEASALDHEFAFEYKIAVEEPSSSPSSTPSSSSPSPQPSTGPTTLLWQPGPNRRYVFPARLDESDVGAGLSPTAAHPLVARLVERWPHQRDGTEVLRLDPYLDAHAGHLRHRYGLFNATLTKIEAEGGGFDRFTRGYELMGFTRGKGPASPSPSGPQPPSPSPVPGIWYREWAPGAVSASLMGDFNAWNDASTPMRKDDFGVFSVFLPDVTTTTTSGGGGGDGGAAPSAVEAIPHDSFLKLVLTFPDGSKGHRVPAWVRYAVYDPNLNEYVGKYWNPPPSARHAWVHPRPRTATADDYNAHPGAPPSPLPSRSSFRGPVRASELADMPAAYKAAVPAAELAALASSSSSPSPASSSLPDPAAAGLRIYEAHVGMASAEGRVATYREFARDVLPRIRALGYNCVQLMAIMEHSYYGSFGYHVNQILAPSSRFGTPEDLKALVDAAHGLGLLVIMDCVHSHANKNVNDGLNRFDGTEHHYFHAGPRGSHDLWDSRLFDYAKVETQRLLLSSLRLFVEDFRFDGFRFDGVTSMMYTHHGLSVGFSGDYNEYFGPATDLDAVVYLMLANHLLHSLETPALSIAEDVSGMPTLCRPVWEGGVGFDFRLGMATPDLWIKFLKEVRDDDWSMDQLVWTLVNRRWQEKTITYAESHDQALVGDKTVAFWLMDKDMYYHMACSETPRHPVIDRGMALHKLIRLLTYTLGGEGYLNFMGNEFGHPEWIDFPREGNSWSYHLCRRQWNLVDDPALLYRFLNAWDGAMHRLEDAFPWLTTRDNFVSTKHGGDKIIVFDRWTTQGPLLFVFNFNPSQSFTGYKIGAPAAGE
jgi:1,4-alpha-glucan branching enzyme